MEVTQLNHFASQYTAAWCSQNAASVASFFAEKGSLKINDGVPAVGPAAISSAAVLLHRGLRRLLVANVKMAPISPGSN